jgi:phospholipid:diacylglycerol acyltransferase
MWMKGGDRIWGDATGAPDDPEGADDTYGNLFSFRHREASPLEADLNVTTVEPNLTLADAGPYILTHTSPDYQRMFESNYSTGFETDVKQLQKNHKDHRKWSNPLEVQLPNAPSMKIYCLYGYGKETEVSTVHC